MVAEFLQREIFFPPCQRLIQYNSSTGLLFCHVELDLYFQPKATMCITIAVLRQDVMYCMLLFPLSFPLVSHISVITCVHSFRSQDKFCDFLYFPYHQHVP